MKLFTITIRASFLILVLSVIGCNIKPKNQTTRKYINEIDSLLAESYERDLFNGNILVTKNDTIIYKKSFGYTDGTQQKKLNNKSIFNIGSIAKEFNAVSIMILVEKGILSLNDSISKFNLGLPDWSKKVTIKHLLNYSSGLPEINYSKVKNDEDALIDLQNLSSLLFEPGTNFNYNSNSIFIQQRIIEKVTEQSFKDFVTENIINPLNMTNSVFDPKYDYPNRTRCFNLEKENSSEFYSNSGWLWVDINDMYKWIEAMNSNTLISQESFDFLLINPYVKDKTSSIGEYFEEDKLQRHNGISYKFESIFLNDFKNNFTIILLSNNRNRVWDLGHTIHNLMLGKDYEIPKKSIYQEIRKESLDNVNKAIDTYYSLKEYSEKEYNFENPSELNKLGYELLSLGKNSESIKIFKLATKEFPKEANLFDSLGEAYYTSKQYDLALDSYNKAISLGGTKGSAEKMVEKIKSENIE